MATIRHYVLCFLPLLLLTTVQANWPCRKETNPFSNKITMICSRSDNLKQFPTLFPNTEVFILTGSPEKPYEFQWAEAFENLQAYSCFKTTVRYRRGNGWTILSGCLREYGNFPGAILKGIKISHTNLMHIKKFRGSSNLIKLDLSNNEIYGIEPEALQDLRDLRELNLSSNKLVKLPSYQFKYLQRLEILDLSNNELITISQQALDGLGSLRRLRLDGNAMQRLDINSINLPMENLVTLNVSHNHLSQWEPNFFSRLTRLEVLDLSHNRLASVNENCFRNLTALNQLSLNSNPTQLIGEKTFSNLSLELLDFSDNNLHTMPSTALKNLRCKTLRLNGNRNLNITDLRKALLDVSSVQNLDMSSMQIKDQDLQSEPFKGLEHCLVRLNLSRNLLTQLPRLADLPKIVDLDFSNNRITTIASNRSNFDIPAFLPKLQSRQAYLYLHGNRFSCDHKHDIAVLKEFEKFNYKCKQESDYYCLYCPQHERRVIDVAQDAEVLQEACGLALSSAQANLTKGLFIYFLMGSILAVFLRLFY